MEIQFIPSKTWTLWMRISKSFVFVYRVANFLRKLIARPYFTEQTGFSFFEISFDPIPHPELGRWIETLLIALVFSFSEVNRDEAGALLTFGSHIRATPPCFLMSAGTLSRAMTAHACK